MSDTVVDPTPLPKTVSFEDYERMKADMVKYKLKAQSFEEETKKKDEAALREKEEWKKLAELKEREAEEERQKNKNFSLSYVRKLRIDAVKDECLKLGIRTEALPDLALLTFDSLIVRQDANEEYVVVGAKDEAERMKMLRPHWFGSKGAPRVNGSAPEVTPKEATKVSVADYMKAEAEAQKTGDWSKVAELAAQFNKQQGG